MTQHHEAAENNGNADHEGTKEGLSRRQFLGLAGLGALTLGLGGGGGFALGRHAGDGIDSDVMKAIQTTPQSEPEANCAAVSSRSLRANWREFELIHRIIHVTMATATNESVPPRISCAWNDSV